MGKKRHRSFPGCINAFIIIQQELPLNGFAHIPWEDTPDFPKPHKERNSFRNCWWRVRGIFQGYVGEILDPLCLWILSKSARVFWSLLPIESDGGAQVPYVECDARNGTQIRPEFAPVVFFFLSSDFLEHPKMVVISRSGIFVEIHC